MKYIKENSYGFKKRLDFLVNYIRKNKINSVLEIGCGTGLGILFPLAKIFDKISFYGEDIDSKSIEYANQINNLKNLEFRNSYDKKEEFIYDLVILSEVLEHVEDPQSLLINVRNNLTDSGSIFITLPNGFGPFELISTFMRILDYTKLTKILRKFKRKFIPSKSNKTTKYNTDETNLETLANSPHINFFSFKEFKKLIYYSGYKIMIIKNRTFICGDPIDHFINKLNLSEFNSKIADFLPAFMVSDWMFIIEKNKSEVRRFIYENHIWSKFRRFLVNIK